MALRQRIAHLRGPVGSLTRTGPSSPLSHARYHRPVQVSLTQTLRPCTRYASTKSSTEPSGTSQTTTQFLPKRYRAAPPPASPFNIPTADLKREFLQLQGLVHPDKYPNGVEKQHAEGLSARINEAYRTLVDPLQRAQYILREWHGIDVTAEDAATKHALDPETLMEVMEVQETIEEVGATAEGEGQINALKKENEVRVLECVESLSKAFESGELEAARKECIRLRFWYSVGEGLREWEPGNTEIRLMHTS
ncbi:Heat shock cognate protein B C-terminal oligomerization [Penicillium brevicompactum]|uniref:Heat shock cognate protein B C-terminal oligomerization n=1 Tax=Penicillium brevicompactum TaxID=5074 RepID=UPI00254256C1|nr:Heat shock cognate protein B C-terminal oligomerization [Penicillium brevicompactum]KAJ5348128.1 Heat shock cognate protein B C-terminal oligomerization [Penicillium brevicompactum]